MKKQTLLIAMLLCGALCLTGCAGKSMVEDATGLSAEEARAVEKVLSDSGVQAASVEAADLPDAAGDLLMQEGYTGYLVRDKAGAGYTLVLHGARVIAVMAEDGAVVYDGVSGNG